MMGSVYVGLLHCLNMFRWVICRGRLAVPVEHRRGLCVHCTITTTTDCGRRHCSRQRRVSITRRFTFLLAYNMHTHANHFNGCFTAYDCEQWREIVETAKLLQGHATWLWWWYSSTWVSQLSPFLPFAVAFPFTIFVAISKLFSVT